MKGDISSGKICFLNYISISLLFEIDFKQIGDRNGHGLTDGRWSRTITSLGCHLSESKRDQSSRYFNRLLRPR